jgi:hypothetical protein
MRHKKQSAIIVGNSSRVIAAESGARKHRRSESARAQQTAYGAKSAKRTRHASARRANHRKSCASD